MQYFAIAVVIVVALCALRRFRATVIVWMVAQTLLNAQIAVKYSSPALSCMLAVDIVLTIIFLFKIRGRNKIKFEKGTYLFKAPMMLMLSSYIVTILLAPYNTLQGFNSAIKFFVANFILLYLFQRCLVDKRDIKLFVKTCVVIVILQCTLALSESIFHDNIWLDIVYNTSPHNEATHARMFYTPEHKSIRYGLARCQGFFSIHILFGVFCAIFFGFIMVVYRRKWRLINQKVLLTSIVLLFAGIMMSNSKTGMVGLILILLGIYRPLQLLNIKVGGIIILLAGIVIVFFPGYIYNIFSLFDESLAAEGGGSTVTGRKVQFMAAYRMFMLNPFFGSGIGSFGVLSGQGFEEMLGAESSWMQILPERGIYGGIMYILMYICIYKVFRQRLGKRFTFFYLLSIFTMESATGIYDFGMALWGSVLITMAKYSRLRKKSSYLLYE